MIYSFSILFFLLFAFLPQAYAQVSFLQKLETSGTPLRLQAEHISYDGVKDTYLAEGKVEVWQDNRKLAADRIILNARTAEVEASGNVVLIQGKDVLQSERMKINLETNLGIIIQGSLFLKQQNFYLRGEEIERLGEDTYRVRGGSFTTCEGDWPAWRFTGKETVVTLEEYATVRGATFQVKNIPILYSPYLIFPVKTQRQSGFLIPRITYSDTAGVELNSAYFWAIAKNKDATFFLDLASIRGVGEGVEYRYVRRNESQGIFYGRHLRETESYRQKRSEQLDRNPDRWHLDFQHEEYVDRSFFAKTRIRGVSDRQYFQDYGSTYEDRSGEQVYSFLSLTKNWERFSLFGEARHTVDLRQEDKTTLQNYPLIHFAAMRQPLLSSLLYFSLDSSYGYFWRDRGVTGHRMDLHPRLSLPLKWKFLEISPEMGARETIYHSRDGSEESQNRTLWDFKTTVATEIFRIFDTGLKGISKLKHIIRPEITYAYIPDVDQSRIPDYDTPVLRSNAITYGITQRLIGKVAEEPGKTRYHEFAYFKVSQTYDLFEADRKGGSGSEPSRPFGLISAEVRIKTLHYINAENITTYDPNQNRFLTSYTTAGLRDSRGDQLFAEYSWAEGTQDQINGNLRIKILPVLDVFFGKRYSFLDRQNLETVYGLHYRHQCWSMELSYLEKPPIAGQPAEKKAMVMFTLSGVTSVGTR